MSIWKRLFGKKEPQQQGERVVGKILGKPVIDLRDDKERHIERDAYGGESLGAEADQLIAELIRIGRSDGYLSMNHGGKFGKDGKHVRAREIGEALNKRGGMELMQAAYYRVRATIPEKARSLESAWGHIGEWLP